MPRLGTWRNTAQEVLEEYNQWTDALASAIEQEADRPSWLYDFQTRDERREALDNGERDFAGLARYARYFGAALAQRPDLATEGNPLFHGDRAYYLELTASRTDADAIQEVADREGLDPQAMVKANVEMRFWAALREGWVAEAHSFWGDNPDCAPEWWLEENFPETATCSSCGRGFRVNVDPDSDAGGDADCCGDCARALGRITSADKEAE